MSENQSENLGKVQGESDTRMNEQLSVCLFAPAVIVAVAVPQSYDEEDDEVWEMREVCNIRALKSVSMLFD